MQLSSFSSLSQRIKTRWNNSWLTDRIELNGGVMGACRHEKVQPKLAGLAILGLLVGQTLLPGVMLLSNVQAAELRGDQARKQQKQAREANTPAWAKALEARVEQEGRERNLRLTQGKAKKDKSGDNVFNRPPLIPVPGSVPGEVVPSSDLECPDCEIDVRALDLTKVPSEKDLRKAGQLGGALNPTRSAEPEELGLKLDKLVKRAGIEGGLKAQLPKKDPRERGLQKAKEKYAVAEAINLDFGKAIQEWNKHNYREAAKMFKKHLKDFPESPWGGEAMLHLGCDAKYNGRFDEAQTIYNEILEKTSDKPNKKLKKARKERKERGGGPDVAELERAVAEAASGTQSLEVAVEKLDRASEEDDESFELHQKALMRWADLDIATGHWNDAAKKLQHLIATDTDWRRVTWAQGWLTNLTNLGPQARILAACGPKALERVLLALHRPDAAKRAGAVVPPTLAGLSLAELEQLAAKSGAPLRAFKVSDPKDAGAALEALTLPAIVHTDGARGFDRSKSYFAGRELKRAPLVAMHPDMKAKGQLPAQVAKSLAADKGGAAKALFESGLQPSGHYLVLEQVDARTQMVKLFDPSESRFYQMSYEQLGRQWSGKGLAQGDLTRLAKLSLTEKAQTRGGCCGSATPSNGTGCCPDNSDGNGGCGDGTKASPVWAVNRTNLNLFVKDTPLWVKTAKGPDVEITMSYNSQDSLTQGNAFGNKWMFNYGSYVTEDPQAGGGQLLVFMPDGSQDTYYPNGSGGYTTQADNQNTLVKLSASRYELRFPGGDKAIYDQPSNTTSLQSFMVELRDRHGYSLYFGYDAKVRLVKITDADGNTTNLEYYSGSYKVAKVWDPWGRYASFGYDASGNLTEAIDMEGHSFQYTYDSVYDQGKEYWGMPHSNATYLTRLNTAQGAWTFTHVYGFPTRTVTATDPNGKSEVWQTGWGGATRGGNYSPGYYHTDKRGATTGADGTIIEGYRARISAQTYPDGSTSSKNIDPQTGVPTSITGRDGKTTQIRYNAKLQPTQITDPKGQTTSFSYHPNGLDVASITNAKGQTVATYQYDNKHQPTQIQDITGTTTQLSYTAWGAPQTVSANGHTTQMVYNGRGFVAATQRDGVTLGQTTYDEKGRVKTQTDQMNLTVAYEYNNIDHVTKEKYPDGTSVSYDYTCCGLPGVVTDRAGRKSYYDYDPMRRLARVQDANGGTLQMDYDAEGNLARLLDGKGNITKWQYTGAGQLAKKIYADGTEQTYGYAGGRLSASRDARNRLTNFLYDANGNLSKIDYPNDADVSLTYNNLDKPLTMTDALGTTTFGYDAAARLTSVDGPWNNDTVNYAYDAEGRRSALGVQKPDGTLDTTGYLYDALGRLDKITSSAGTFDYNYAGQTSRVTQLLMPNGARTNYSYTALGELDVLQNVAANGSNISRYDYNYDARGVRAALQEQIEQDPVKTLQFSYDVTNQLEGEQVTGGKAGEAYTSTYAYDGAGNRTKFTKTSATENVVEKSAGNKLNQTKAVSTTDNGKVSTLGLSYDEAGNLAQVNSASGSSDHVFDDANRLKAVVSKTAAGVNQAKTEFVYSGKSLLQISRSFVWQGGQWMMQGEKRRVYDGKNVVQERDGAGALVATYTRGKSIGSGIGGLLSRTFESGTSFMHYDGRGNVVQLTNASGLVSGKYTYDAFGRILSITGGAAGLNPYRFSTKEHVGSLVYYGYRFYSPSLGKWINRDPIKERGGVNLYGAMNNDTINRYDTDGRIVMSPPTSPLPPTQLPFGPPIARPWIPRPIGGPVIPVVVIVYATYQIVTYKPCQPFGWGNSLTWVGDRIADRIYGPLGCGGGGGGRPPTEEECRTAYDECNAKCGDENPVGPDYDPWKYDECTEKCQNEYIDCQRRRDGK